MFVKFCGIEIVWNVCEKKSHYSDNILNEKINKSTMPKLITEAVDW